MSSSAFKKALANRKSGGSKDLGGLIVGQYLNEGVFDVTIQGTDTQFLDNDQIALSFADAEGKIFNDRMFLMDYRDKDAFSFSLRQFWSAVVPNQDAIVRFMEVVAETDKAWAVFTGMKCQITLKRGPGFKISVMNDDSGDKKYFTVDAENGEDLGLGFFNEAKEAEDAARAANHRKSYIKIGGMAATNGEENLNAFYTSIEKVASAASNSGSGPGATGGTKTPPAV